MVCFGACSIDKVVGRSYQWYAGLEQLNSVPEMYLGRLSSRKDSVL